MSWLFALGGKSIGASAAIFLMNIQGSFPLGLTGLISSQSKGLSTVFSGTTIWKHHSLVLRLLHGPALTSFTTTGKTIALTRQTFIDKVMSLLFNTLSRFVIAFLLRNKWLNFMAAVTVHSDFGAQENKICHCFNYLPIYLSRSDETRCHDLSFLNIEFQASFSISSFHPLQEALFSSLSAIRVVSSACLRLLIFLLAILIPAWASSSPAFHMMYFAYKLNKQGDNIQPWHTPFPISNQFIVPCLILTCI